MMYTYDQTRAIAAPTADILVSAAAGSGKTAVLTERVVRLVAEAGADIDRLLVVTFTEAAAAEMRRRVYEKLTALARKEPGERLSRQLALLGDCSIMTIHAFCLRVIRRHFYALDIDPAFRVADTAETAILKNEALDDTLEEWYARDDAAFTRLAASFGKVEDDGLRALVLRTHNYARADADPRGWLARQTTDTPIAETPAYRAFIGHARRILQNALENALAARAIAEHPDLPPKYMGALDDDITAIRAALYAADSGLEALYHAVYFTHTSLVGGKRVTDDDLKALGKRVADLRDAGVKKPLSRLRERALFKPPAELVADAEAAAEGVSALCRLTLDFDARFSAMKRERCLADFGDFEQLCLRLLRDADIQAAVRNQYDEILIDEYQDVNPAQEAILAAVSRGGNRFMVGDVKQSVYRFRMANPALFREKERAYATNDAAPQRLIRLRENFRSRAGVLAGVNSVFRRLMSDALGETDYDDDAALRPGAAYPPGDETVDVVVIESAEEREGEDPEIAEMTKLEIEARAVAALVTEAVAARTVTEGNVTRPARFGDVAILLRSPGGTARAYADALRALNAPVLVSAGAGYFDAEEVMAAVSILQIIDNPRQDVPLIAVLHSPAFGFSADDLARLRLSGAGAFYDCVAGYDADDDLGRKTAAFRAWLNGWRARAVYTPVSRLVWAAMEENGLFALYAEAARQANLRALFERASAYERTSLRGLFNFIKYLERAKAAGDAEPDAPAAESDDAVRVMSIHKSKGLEFPIVFVCGLGKRFNLSDNQAPFLLHRALGVGAYYLDAQRVRSNTLTRFAIAETLKAETLSEELRVLYVAMTRAGEKLTLVGSGSAAAADVPPANGKIPAAQLSDMRTYLDWLLAALSAMQQTETGWADGEAVFRLRSHPPVVEIKAQEASVGALTERPTLASKPAISPLTKIPAKMSVTEIKRAYYAEQLSDGEPLARPAQTLARPRFLSGLREPDAGERGILLHSAMERLDFHLPPTDAAIAEFLTNLERIGVLKTNESRHIPVDGLRRFLQSNLADRMRRAKIVHRERRFVYGAPPESLNPDWAGVASPNVLVHGVIDCFFEEDGHWVLVDYKTDATVDAERYRLQMALYKQAVERATNRPVAQSVVYFFSQNEAVVL